MKGFGHRLELSLSSQLLFGPLQPPGIQDIFEKPVRSTGHAEPFVMEFSRRISDTMKIARSTCLNGLVWKELWPAEYCFVGSLTAWM